jgi:hypothetical protein
MPYDRTIWKQIKTFWWWVFFLIGLIPTFGVNPLYNFFGFVMIDKEDEYQLVSYILDYKAAQFLTQGVISASTAYVQYYYCATMNKNDPKVRADCFD